jgi:hypothetical protein
VKIGARLLVRLYPRRWRERYGEEFTALTGPRVDWRTGMDILKSAISERGRQPGAPGLERLVKLMAASAAIVLMLIWFVTAFEIVTFAHRTPTLGDFARATSGALASSGFQRMLAGLFVVPMLLSILLARLVIGFRLTQSHATVSRWMVRLGVAGVYVGFVLANTSLRQITSLPLPLFGAVLLFVLIGLVVEWALLRGRVEPGLNGPPAIKDFGVE